MTERLGLIGIGNMGRPIAENLLRRGFSLTVYDLKDDVKEGIRDKGPEIAQSPAELAKKSDVILLLVNDSKGVKNVLFEKNGIVQGANKGTIVLDMTTSDPQFSKKFENRLQKWRIEYLDAPMAGGVLAARNSQLLLMVGGKRKIYEKCLHIFEAISKKAIYMGDIGRGHLIKLIHNQLSHATFLANCEAVVLGETLGLSMNTMIEVFNQGNARSYSTEVRFPKFILSGTFDMGATFATVYKDISLVRKIGNRAKLRLPINDCTYKYWKYPVDKGDGEEDISRVIMKMKDLLLK